MSFLHPFILAAGLGALSIPVLVHLLRRRRKPIPWAAMRFLQEAVRKRRRRLRLEQLLLFLTRLTIVALLAVAVARPVLGGRPGASGPVVLVLAIDDSIASALTEPGQTGPALARSIDRARAELDALSPMGGDRVGLVTLGSPGRALVWPPTGDTDSVRRAMDRLQPTDSAPSFESVRRSMAELRNASDDPAGGEPIGNARVVLRVFSGWRGVDPERFLAGAGVPGVDEVLLDQPASPTADAGENIGIRSITPTTPTILGETGASALAPPTRVAVTLVRSGPAVADERLVEVEVIAHPGGSIAGRAEARFAPGQDTAQTGVTLDDAALTPGRGGRVAIEARLPPDANPRDNTARAVLTVRRELRVGVVERRRAAGDDKVAPGVWALAALTPDARAGVDAFRIDPASLASVPAASIDALLILEPARLGPDSWARARELLARGGLVAVTPDATQGPAGPPAWADSVASLTGNALTLTGVPDESPARLDPRPAADGVLAGLAGEFEELARSVGVNRAWPLTLTGDARATLRTDRGSVFLAEAPGPDGRGVVAVFASAFDLDWTDLPARPAFLPVMQELVRRGSGLGVDLAMIAGLAPPEDGAIDRWSHDAELSAGPMPSGEAGARAGVMLGVGREGSVVRSAAINPDAAAAMTTPASVQGLRSAAANAMPGAEITIGSGSVDTTTPADPARAAAVRSTPAGDRIALLLLALAAVLAVGESLLARAASHPEGASARPRFGFRRAGGTGGAEA